MRNVYIVLYNIYILYIIYDNNIYPMPHATVSNKKTLDKNDIAPGISLVSEASTQPATGRDSGITELGLFPTAGQNGVALSIK